MLLYFVSHIKCFHLDTWPKMKNEKKLECFLRIWALLLSTLLNYRSSHPEVFLRKGVLEICSKFTGEHPCRGGISITLNGNFIEITLRHGCSPVNLQHIFRTPFPRNTHLGDCFWLLLEMNIKFYAIPTELWWYYWDLVVKGGENSFVDLFLNISVTIRLRYKSHIEWILQTDNGSFCLFP